jgi:hypothetical protein
MDVQSARPSNSKRLDCVQRVSMKCSFEPKQAGIAGGERHGMACCPFSKIDRHRRASNGQGIVK